MRTACKTLVLLITVLVVQPVTGDEVIGPRVYRKALTGTVLVLWEKDGGTGWLVDRERRLVITNYHVVREQKDVIAFFPRFRNGKLVAEKKEYRKSTPIKGEVLRTDKDHDLALIRLERVPRWATELKMATQDPGPGERVHSVGHPARSDALFVYSTGFVRSLYFKQWEIPSAEKTTLKLASRIVEMGSPINPGDSGSALLNDRGEVIGVVQGLRLDSLTITYAIAASEVKTFLAGKKQTIAVKR